MIMNKILIIDHEFNGTDSDYVVSQCFSSNVTDPPNSCSTHELVALPDGDLIIHI